MRMAYSAVAHFLVQWTDCKLAGALGLLKVMLYKVSSPTLCLLASLDSNFDFTTARADYRLLNCRFSGDTTGVRGRLVGASRLGEGGQHQGVLR